MQSKDNFESDFKRASNIVSLLKSLSLNRKDLVSKEKPTNKVDHMLNANKTNLQKLISSLEKSSSNPDITELETDRRKRKIKEISDEANDIEDLQIEPRNILKISILYLFMVI